MTSQKINTSKKKQEEGWESNNGQYKFLCLPLLAKEVSFLSTKVENIDLPFKPAAMMTQSWVMPNRCPKITF